MRHVHNWKLLEMMEKKGAYAALFGLLIGAAAFAGQALDQVVVQRNELPKGWSFVSSYYSVSETASDFFENYELSYASKVGATVAAKKFQSFVGPSRGTVFYLQFANESDAQRAAEFARKLVWEGGGATDAHPERIFTVDAVLVTVSCANKDMSDQLERTITSRKGSK